MSSKKSELIHSMLPLIFPLDQVTDIPLIKSEADACSSTSVNPKDSWHFLSHAILKNPRDLQSHTRRIFIAMRHQDAEFLHGALQDLFIILKAAGKQLRIRLLKASASYLSKQEIQYFASWIKSQDDPQSDDLYGYKWVTGSVLSSGLAEKDKQLIVQDETSSSLQLSAIEEARSSIEYGQLDIARKILEDALINDPDNLTLREELDNLLTYIENDNQEQTHAVGQ